MPDEKAYISKITLPTGSTYHIKDEEARSNITQLQTLATGAMYYIGISTTTITDGGTQNPTIDSAVKTMTANEAGAVCIFGEKEYVWNGSKWQEFGSTGSLKALAFKDNASGSFTPTGDVSTPTFTGSSSPVTITATSDANGNYQPAGEISVPSISVDTEGSTTTVNSITDVGTLPSWGGSVENETLTISWSTGTLPSKGANTTVKTGDASYRATAPTFTGTKVQLAGTTTAAGTVSQPSFTGTEGTVTVS
jgi:hypothetical protein